MDFLQSIPLVLIIAALVIGTALVILEMFLPGLGVSGITGALLIVFGIIALAAKIGAYVIFVVLFILALILLTLMMLSNSAKTGRNPLILSAAFKREEGFSANTPLESYIGKNGIALTELRPAGIAFIEDTRMDVVTEGEFIEKNSHITVTSVEGRRIVVKINNEQ